MLTQGEIGSGKRASPVNRAHVKWPLDQLKVASFFSRFQPAPATPLPLDGAPVLFETNTFICFYFNITP